MQIIINLPPPPTHQAALRILKTRDGRQFIGKMAKSSAKKWSVAATLLIRNIMSRLQYQQISESCYVSIKFFYPHTKDSKRESVKTGNAFIDKCTRPDLDNLCKSVLDCLVDGGALKDDGLVHHLSLIKYHYDEPKVVVDIYANNDDT